MQTINFSLIFSLVLSRPPHPPSVRTIQSQQFQDLHILERWKLSPQENSPFKTPHSPKLKIIQKQYFKNHYILSKWNLSRISFFPRPPHPLKVVLIQNQSFQDTTPSQVKFIEDQSFQDHHSLPRWKLSKISPYKPNTSPKVEIIQNQSFQDHHNLPSCAFMVFQAIMTFIFANINSAISIPLWFWLKIAMAKES